MKKLWKYLTLLPLGAISMVLGSCASTPACNNDACYDRNLASSDPYKKGEIAAWGSEKKSAEQEEEGGEQADRAFELLQNQNRSNY